MSGRAQVRELLAVWEQAGRKPTPEELCLGRPELLQEVRRQIAIILHVDSMLDPETGDMEDTACWAAADNAGTTVGNYEILGTLGEGGFSVVYVAQQHRPVQRRVALKVLKPGMDSRQVLARFEAERQALAMMDHPNVAKVYDAGTTPEGRPFFVMELVKGEPITDFCDRNRLTIHHRLELFIHVCEAVQHAHMKGIIHRDLKPSNILAELSDQKPVVKVIDFGVAKAISHPLTERTIFTEQGQLIGTPQYMSPEQADLGALDIDTRSDVYSLGVVLYELLTGATPFDPKTLRQAALGELQRIIREVDPPNPSVRLSTADAETGAAIAKARQADRERLAGELRRELEWIPLKALRKDRSRRYASAESLAADVRRYLEGRPLEAAPESRGYLLRKFLHRHRMEVIAASVVLCVLVIGIITTSWGFVTAAHRAEGERQAKVQAENKRNEAEQERTKAQQERDKAEAARKRAEAINQFVTTALRSSDPFRPLGSQDTTIVQAMENAIKDIQGGRFKDDPETEAALENTIAAILMNGGRDADAEPLFLHSLETRQRLFGGDHESVAGSLNDLAACLDSLGRSTEALARYEAALAMRQRLVRGDDPIVAIMLSNVATSLVRLGRNEEAIPKFEAAMQMQRRLHDDPGVAFSLNNLAGCLLALGRSAEALSKFEGALDIRQRLANGDHPLVAATLQSMGQCLISLGRLDEAMPRIEAALSMYRRLFKGDHPGLATTLGSMACYLDSSGRHAEALAMHEESLAMSQRLFKGDHPNVAAALMNLAACLDKQGQSAAALPKFEAALEIRRRLFKSDHLDLAASLNNVAHCLQSSGRHSEALSRYQESLAIIARLFKGDNRYSASAMHDLGSCLVALGRPAEALPKLEAALEMQQRLFKGDHPQVAKSLNDVAGCLNSLGRTAEALPKVEAALEMHLRLFKGDSTGAAALLDNAGNFLRSLNRPADALAKYQAALEIRQRLFKADHADVADALSNLATCLHSLGRDAEALAKAEQAVAMAERILSRDDPSLKRYRTVWEECHKAVPTTQPATRPADFAR